MISDLKTISIYIVKPEQMRYSTVGDWDYDGNVMTITVADTGSETANQAIILHELVEAMLCRSAGITAKQVDDWDLEHDDPDEESGEVFGAPYYFEHQSASTIERMFIDMNNTAWGDYDQIVEDTAKEVEKHVKSR